MIRTTTLAATISLAALPALAAPIVVSSKIDTEGGLLGNVIYLALQDAGLDVQDRLQLGGTPILRDAITSGLIDIYPEYTGNAAFFFNEADSDIWKDAAAAAARAAELDLAANNIVWLDAAPANNTWAIALRDDVAGPNDLVTMSDLGRFISDGGDIRLVASTEFVTSPSALPAFQEAYGFTLSPNQIVQLSGGDTAATIAAAAQQTSGVNAAMVYGTDGAISAVGLRVMEDDLSVQPVYQPAPLVRAEILESNPQIAEILNPIFAVFDLETLQELNGRIQIGGEPAQAVARDFLTTQGFID
ncbi:MAG: glycine betaine ABC transporter substrate-binding protein [Paracoccus sp. (in: a-proteobacteria)]|nr:glycine betaine ABC transporter substrate-binding protein [Paracoccus sp. (in: a-proteobacteria)]